MKKFILFILIFSYPPLRAQTEKNSVIEQRIEWIAENSGQEDPDLSVLFDELNYFYDHPLDLNTASEEELNDLVLLNQVQIHSLLHHIQKNGKLISIYELQAVDNFDLIAIRNILPFVNITDRLQSFHLRFSRIPDEGSHELFYRHSLVLERSAGYADTGIQGSDNLYSGTRDKIYTRYRFRVGRYISIGITGEKDPGEQFFSGNQKQGYDFYSAHLFLKNIRGINSFAVGDYQVSFGQGLTFGTGISLGKSIGIKRTGTILRPYTSAGENEAMRGAAFIINKKKFSFTPFFSSSKKDANLIGDSIISSLQTSGVHSTSSQLQAKDAVQLTQYGGNVSWSGKRMRIGITAVRSEFDKSFEEKKSWYNKFDHNGNGQTVAGIDLSYLRKNVHFFSESSVSLHTKGKAFLAGIIVAPDAWVTFSLLYRNYEKEFQNRFSNAFSENTKPANEQGLLLGIETSFNHRWKFNGYVDSFRSAWLKYQLSSPSYGYELLAQLTWKLSRKTEIYWRYRHQSKLKNEPGTEGLSSPENISQENFRLHLQLKTDDKFTLRTRMEMVQYHPEHSNPQSGYLIYQDLIYKPVLSKFSVTLRYAVFSTDSYDTRIYAFENDVLNYFGIPAYSNHGTRFYGILKLSPFKNTDLWIRYAQYLYNNVNSIGSGMDLIEGNRKSELRLQVRITF